MVAYLEAENSYADTVLQPLEAFEETLYTDESSCFTRPTSLL